MIGIFVLLFLVAIFAAAIWGVQSPPAFPFTASTIINTRPNTITTRFSGWHDEAKSSFAGTFYPGSLLQRQSDGSVTVHSSFGGAHEKLFAKEDALQGKSILDGYVVDDPVFYGIGRSGDHLLMLLAPGATTIIGSALVSNGDGQVVVNPGASGSQLYTNAADSTAVANTAAQTKFNKSFVIPANVLQVGDVIKVKGSIDAIGVTATPTLRTKLLLVSGAGSPVTITVMDTGALAVIAGDIVEFEANIIVRTIGAAGTIVADGWFNIGTPGTATHRAFVMPSTAIDTTQTQEVEVTGQWSAASASNTAVLRIMNIELEKAPQVVAYAEEALNNSAGLTFLFCNSRIP